MFLSRAATLTAVVCLIGCQSGNQVSLSRPKPPSSSALQQALGGVGYAGTASFNAPVVDPATWSGAPIGTGSFNVQSTPPQSGGSQSIAADDASDPSQVVHYIIIGNLQAPSGALFGIVSLKPFAAGSLAVDNVDVFAGLFDAATGSPTAMASSGTVTFTAVGSTLVGSFSGTLDDYAAPPPGCQVDADCARGEVCQAGQCVQGPPPGCTSNSQCPAGSSCQAGQCVANPNPGCTSNSQCSSPAVCVNGACVVQGACRVDADCPGGQVCQAGQCVTGPSTGRCDGQGTGAYSGSVGSTATCSLLGGGALSVTQGFAALGEDENGVLSLYLLDAASQGDGVALPLSACPAQPGSLSVSGAKVYSVVQASGLTLYAARDASGSLSFSTVSGSHLQGTFTLNVSGGGTVSGTFDVQ